MTSASRLALRFSRDPSLNPLCDTGPEIQLFCRPLSLAHWTHKGFFACRGPVDCESFAARSEQRSAIEKRARMCRNASVNKSAVIVFHGARWLILFDRDVSFSCFAVLVMGSGIWDLCRGVGQTLILNSSLVQCRGGGEPGTSCCALCYVHLMLESVVVPRL